MNFTLAALGLSCTIPKSSDIVNKQVFLSWNRNIFLFYNDDGVIRIEKKTVLALQIKL